MHWVQMCEENNSRVAPGVLRPCQDDFSRWWAAVMASACHLLYDEFEQAREFFQTVEAYPVSTIVLKWNKCILPAQVFADTLI